MRNPSWCTPEQSLHHLCEQSTYCLFQELISSWVSGCQACALRAKLAQRKEERRERKREPEKYWQEERTRKILTDLLPEKAQNQPKTSAFCFLQPICPLLHTLDSLTRAYAPSERKQLTLFLKMGGGGQNYPENTPHYFFIPSSLTMTVPFPFPLLLGAFDLNMGIPMLSSGSCLWH